VAISIKPTSLLNKPIKIITREDRKAKTTPKPPTKLVKTQ